MKQILLWCLVLLMNLFANLAKMKNLFFFYETIFRRIGARLPLSSFEKDILNVLSIAPAQLHPNSWTFLISTLQTYLVGFG